MQSIALSCSLVLTLAGAQKETERGVVTLDYEVLVGSIQNVSVCVWGGAAEEGGFYCQGQGGGLQRPAGSVNAFPGSAAVITRHCS